MSNGCADAGYLQGLCLSTGLEEVWFWFLSGSAGDGDKASSVVDKPSTIVLRVHSSTSGVTLR